MSLGNLKLSFEILSKTTVVKGDVVAPGAADRSNGALQCGH